MLTVHDVQRLLPHRYPFLLVDTVLEYEVGVWLVARKLVSHDEPFFRGHFPEGPTMPGLLVVEALAQAGGLLLMSGLAERRGEVVYFASLDAVRWHGLVRPGDDLRLEVRVIKSRGALHKVHGEARVDDVLVCEGDLGAVLARP
jgi:3-hydroxyacyl-[acyl-carrier-protein] dehydratase